MTIELQDIYKQKENRMPTTFFPLNSVQSAVKSSRDDLAKARAINATLSAKVAALSNRSQYNQSYIVTETAKLREAAREELRVYLERRQTYQTLTDIKNQRPFWTVRGFLSRALVLTPPALEKFDESGNAAKVMRALLASQQLTNALLSVARMDVDSVARAPADAAAARGDWASVSAAFNELAARGEAGNDEARRITNRL